MKIRKGRLEDIEKIFEVENQCFSIEEAASKESLINRLQYYSDNFWILEDEENIISFVNGPATDEKELRDEMFTDVSLHNKKGQWQMILGVSTAPKYRKKGFAEKLLREVIQETKRSNKKGLVLTCKEKLVHFYAKLGFVDEGLSDSTHGGAVWHKMRLTF